MTTTDLRAARVDRTSFGLGSAFSAPLFTPAEVAAVSAAVHDVPALASQSRREDRKSVV